MYHIYKIETEGTLSDTTLSEIEEFILRRVSNCKLEVFGNEYYDKPIKIPSSQRYKK